ncbi:MAG: nucleoside triphosphate pyrophosphohydrolase [Rectinema subterraneum]|uniref:nucleoside triphosphate pyrophosphohydrolase n=1 Tax=Rectinema subterraneum TaxID=2653714 RepID=UPI003C7E748F
MEIDTIPLETLAGQMSEQILPEAEEAAAAFKLFFTIVARLRAPDGCPWDLAQTPTSIRGNIIEEAYELAEAITENDSAHIQEENGDLYLLATMVGYMSQQEDRYHVADALREAARKLIRRHPHVFGDSTVDSPEQVVEQWNDIKERVEGRRKKDSLLDEVHRHLPPLEKAYKIQKKAAKVGFDWQKREDIWIKLAEEMEELKTAAGNAEPAGADNAGAEPAGRGAGSATDATTAPPDANAGRGAFIANPDALEEEFGDLLFTVINAARLYGVDPTIALHRSNEKFSRRFRHVEARMKASHLAMAPEHMTQMDAFWDEAKRAEDGARADSARRAEDSLRARGTQPTEHAQPASRLDIPRSRP